MAKEVCIVKKTSLNILKNLFKEDLISFDKQYDELTLKFKGYYLWCYVYKDTEEEILEEEIGKLNLNIKYEAETPLQVIADFKKKALMLGLKEGLL
ncbi:hypothetical protein [Capnocytophaga sputigena]|jgi:hypothetical protein|uniref:hypothetical protein n=1 Tax=Capnocytophaga sputigena TaxID=1019 RepID=UPI0028F0FAAE|nr:hypothetical protein [Capnocytophaga sputigena]